MLFRLVVWNCAMGLHDKVERLTALRPDVAVVPECACPEVLLRRSPVLGARAFAWTGSNPRKGLAAFSFGRWRIAPDRSHDPREGSVLPLRVTGPATLRLLAVWAPSRGAHRPWEREPVPLPGAIARLERFVSEPPALIAGDFNQTLVAPRAGGRRVPSVFARRLESLGFRSAYHLAREVAIGAEAEGTFCRHRRPPAAHHADYVFLDAQTAPDLRQIEIAAADRWLDTSDHAPVVVVLDLTPRSGCPAPRTFPPG